MAILSAGRRTHIYDDQTLHPDLCKKIRGLAKTRNEIAHETGSDTIPDRHLFVAQLREVLTELSFETTYVDNKQRSGNISVLPRNQQCPTYALVSPPVPTLARSDNNGED